VSRPLADSHTAPNPTRKHSNISFFFPGTAALIRGVGQNNHASRFQAEFRVTYMDGSVETFPNLGFIEVFVTEDVPGLPVLPG